MEFKKPEPSDGEWVKPLLKQSDFYGCEYAFGNTYMWSGIYDIQIARRNDFYLVRNRYGFLYPAGGGDIAALVGELREYCRHNNHNLRFTNAPKECAEMLRCMYGNKVKISTNRDFYDYVYDSGSLCRLSGRKLHSKRNHLHRFNENNWSFEPITPDNIEEVTAMHNKWCEEKQVYCDKDKLREAGAVIRGLDAFFALGFTGGAIRVDGEIAAYTFGEPAGNSNDNMFIVHVEKAFSAIQGAYAAINREFVSYVCGEPPRYRYINREEDMGAENLRKAKMSYCPAFLVEKYSVEIED